MPDGIMALRGLREMTIEELLVDNASTLTYGDAFAVEAPQLMGYQEVDTDIDLPAADDIADTDSFTQAVDVTIKFGKMHLENLARLLGATIDTSGGKMQLIRNKADIRPYFRWKGLVAYLGQGQTGVFELHIPKGKVRGGVSWQHNGESPEYATVQFTVRGIARVNDGEFSRLVQDPNGTTLPTGTPDTTPPSATVAPLDTATDVAINTNVVWTFDEEIQFDAQQFKLYRVVSATDLTEVAASVTINGAGTVVTLNPTSDLANAEDYVGMATGIRDIAGNQRTSAIVNNFTTIA